MLTLIHSGAGSPFGRKVRILLHEMGLRYEEEVRPGIRPVEELGELNPGLALPVLKDGGELLFGSDLIIEFLLERYPGERASGSGPPLAGTLTRPEARWRDLKILATINTFADTVVNVRHFRSEGVTGDRSRYMARQEARLHSCLDWLERQASSDGFWPGFFSVMDIALICPLYYASTRGVIDWRDRPTLRALYDRWQARNSVRATAETPAKV